MEYLITEIWRLPRHYLILDKKYFNYPRYSPPPTSLIVFHSSASSLPDFQRKLFQSHGRYAERKHSIGSLTTINYSTCLAPNLQETINKQTKLVTNVISDAGNYKLCVPRLPNIARSHCTSQAEVRAFVSVISAPSYYLGKSDAFIYGIRPQQHLFNCGSQI